MNNACPYFCLTADVDWASEYAIDDFITFAASFSIKPMIFGTHSSQVLQKHYQQNRIEIGAHPNYLPGSTQGNDIPTVNDHIFQLFPMAKAFRAHSFYNHYAVEHEMAVRQIKYDSNICLYLQPGIVPLRRALGSISFPVFWEDDVHWYNNGTWDPDKYLSYFTTPGLKLINVHPFFFTANVPDREYYLKVRDHTKTVSAEDIKGIRYDGKGVRTFILDLFAKLKVKGHKFYSFSEICEMSLSSPSTLIE